MKNIVLRVQFDGRNYYGFQIQNDKKTIQGEIEKALKEITGEEIRVNGCSRTDSGVSARSYYLNFKTNSTIPSDRICHPINDILPMDIRVLESYGVDIDFHARFLVKSKTYSYTLINDKINLPLEPFTSLEKHRLDFETMFDCLEVFKGEHDFKAFMSTGNQVQNTVRKINDISLKKENNKIKLIVNGDGFLYNMVRIIMGTLVYVGQGTLNKEDVIKAIETGERKYSGKVMPPQGLILEEVYY